MLSEPTTVSDVAVLIAETLHAHYGVDAEALFAEVGLNAEQIAAGGSRVPREKILELWELAAKVTADPAIGLVVGLKVRPTTFHALGFSWLVSRSLHDSLQRLCRYYKVIATVPLDLQLRARRNTYELEISYSDPHYPSPEIAFDSFLASIVALCRTATTISFHPLAIELKNEDATRAKDYRAAFDVTPDFGAKRNALVFDKAELEAPLPGNNAELARATDSILTDYLQALDPDSVSTQVQKFLLALLPTGDVSQQMIAEGMHMSLSTLQRQLKSEDTSYRELHEQTRHALAERYIRDGSHSLSQVAYMLGFSDQSNFTRAFKRWTGQTPKEYEAGVD
ncbi:MAG: AraC family transcriptional regulator [Gammaproteobacteria bacterium]